MSNDDGNLPAAKHDLDYAVSKLIEHSHAIFGNKLYAGPSLYMQLYDAVGGEQCSTGNGGGNKSRPPVWLDALDLLTEIDTALEAWQPAYSGVPATVGRIKHLQQRKWRPQDVRQICQIIAALNSWVLSINTLLNPNPSWTLPNACPACHRAVVYRRDSGGDLIRQPALQIRRGGEPYCRCENCRTVWPEALFPLLAGTLGYQPEDRRQLLQ
jgi:hypothetical protein